LLDIDSLRWTSRDGVGGRLLAFVQATPENPVEDAARLRAARLLAFLAPPSLAPDFLRVALDRSSSRWFRVFALRALARIDHPLPLEALRALLDELPLDVDQAALQCGQLFPPHPPLPEILPLAGGLARESIVLDHLARCTPARLRELLLVSLTLTDFPSPRVKDWLLARWLEDAGGRIPEEMDAAVARCALEDDHPEALAVLNAFWAHHPRGAEFFWDLLRFPELGASLHGEGRDEAARALVLPVNDLLDVLGPVDLEKATREAVLEQSFRFRCPIPPVSRSEEYRYRGALAILEAWAQGPALATDLLNSAVLHADVRAEVGLALFRKRRGAALGLIELRPTEDDNGPLARELLREVAKNADIRDRSPVRAALRSPEPEARFLAIDILEALNEDAPGHRQSLAELAADPDPYVRIRAQAALARRGDTPCLSALVAALGTTDVHLRAEALRRLGELEAAREHFSVLGCALREDHARGEADEHRTPVAEQAALALGAVFGPEALTALLQGYLAARSNATLDMLEAALAVLLEETPEQPRTPAERRIEIVARDGGQVSAWSPFDARRSR
jgi:hypothetical protein